MFRQPFIQNCKLFEGLLILVSFRLTDGFFPNKIWYPNFSCELGACHRSMGILNNVIFPPLSSEILVSSSTIHNHLKIYICSIIYFKYLDSETKSCYIHTTVILTTNIAVKTKFIL